MPQHRRIHVTPVWLLIGRRSLGIVICTLSIATFVFGLAGFVWQYGSTNSVPSGSPAGGAVEPEPRQDWTIPVFKAVQLFLLNSGAEDDQGHPSNWLLMIARIAAGLLFLVVSSAVILRILDDVRRLPGVLTRRDHVVICGLGQIGLQLLDDLKNQGRVREVVIVENNPANPWLQYAENMGAEVLIGDSTRADTLAEARVSKAAEVFVVNGDDGVNLEVVAELGHRLQNLKPSQRQKPLRVHVHIVDTNFATALRPYCSVLHDSPNMSVQVFNVLRNAAAELVTHQLWPFAPKQESEVAHFVILGFGAMGQAMAVQLAQIGSFPNLQRNRFTIADHDIKKSASPFLARYPRFTSWMDDNSGQLGVASFSPQADQWDWNKEPLPQEIKVDAPDAIQYACNAEFVELPEGRSDERFAAKLAKQFTGDGIKPIVFVCGRQDRDNFELAVQLRDQLSCQGCADVPIFVWLPRQPALAETLSRAAKEKIIPFGQCHTAAAYQEITDPLRERIGQKIQEAYEEREAEAASLKGQEYSRKKWADIPDGFRESNRVAADHMLIKLRRVGVEIVRRTTPEQKGGRFTKKFREDTRRTLAKMEHYRWVAERLLAGWRYIPKGTSDAEISEYKRRRFNHNITVFEKSEAEKDFDQIDVIYEECQKLDGFILRRASDTE